MVSLETLQSGWISIMVDEACMKENTKHTGNQIVTLNFASDLYNHLVFDFLKQIYSSGGSHTDMVYLLVPAF